MGEPQDQRSHPIDILGGDGAVGQTEVDCDGGQAESEPESGAEVELETEHDAERRVRERVPFEVNCGNRVYYSLAQLKN